jgi:hypothetical protein
MFQWTYPGSVRTTVNDRFAKIKTSRPEKPKQAIGTLQEATGTQSMKVSFYYQLGTDTKVLIKQITFAINALETVENISTPVAIPVGAYVFPEVDQVGDLSLPGVSGWFALR